MNHLSIAIEAAEESNPVGRPSKFDPAYCEAVIEHMKDGASLSSFAASVDVARSTITYWQGSYPEFDEAVGRAKAKALAWWEGEARKVAKGEGGPGAATMCMFGLKNLGPDDWQDKQQHEHVGKVLHQALSHEEAVAEAARRGLPASVLEE